MYHNKRRKPWRRRGNFRIETNIVSRFKNFVARLPSWKQVIRSATIFADSIIRQAMLFCMLHSFIRNMDFYQRDGGVALYNKIPSLSLDRGLEGTRPKRGIPLLFFARGHDGMRPRWRLKNLAEWSAVKFETRWRFRLSWPEIAQIKSHFRFRSAKPFARVKLSRYHSSIRRLFFLPLIVSLFLNDRKQEMRSETNINL